MTAGPCVSLAKNQIDLGKAQLSNPAWRSEAERATLVPTPAEAATPVAAKTPKTPMTTTIPVIPAAAMIPVAPIATVVAAAMAPAKTAKLKDFRDPHIVSSLSPFLRP